MIDKLTVGELRFTPPSLPKDALLACLQSRWGLTGVFKALTGERDQNLRLTTADGRRFVCKVSSPLEDPLLVDFQTRALQHIERADPSLPVPRLVNSLNGEPMEHLPADDGDTYRVRLLTYLEGVPLADLGQPSPAAVHRIGALQGRMCRALQDFTHPAEEHFMPWDSMNGLVVSPALRTRHLPAELHAAAEPVLQRLEEHVLPVLRDQPAQVIHNDAHSGNVMCDPDQPDRITGVIDFGDLVKRPVVIDLATSITSLIERTPDAIETACTVLRGFEEHTRLPLPQAEVLLDALLARALLTVQLLSFRIAHTETDDVLRQIDYPSTVRGLEVLLAVGRERFQTAVMAGRS